MFGYILFLIVVLLFFLTLLIYKSPQEMQEERAETEREKLIKNLEQERDELIKKANQIMKEYGSESAELYTQAAEIAEQIKTLKKWQLLNNKKI